MKRRSFASAVLAISILALAVGFPPTARAGSTPSATLSLSVSVGPPTTVLAVRGSGYGPTEAVSVTFDAGPLARARTDAWGTFRARVTIPGSALPGQHMVAARGKISGERARTPFTVRTDWAMFHFSADRRGENPYENVLSSSTVGGLAPIWTVQMPKAIVKSPAVAGGVVFIADSGETVAAIQASTGTVLWQRSLGVSGGLNAPAVAGGVVYVSAVAGTLFALDAATGDTIWSTPLAGLIFDSPLVTDAVVYIGAGSLVGTLYALDAATGATMWTTRYGGGLSSPSLAGGVVYVGGGDASVRAFDADTGHPLWTTAVEEQVQGSVSVAADTGLVYAATVNTEPYLVYALDAQTGLARWTYEVGGGVYTTPAVSKGLVYVGSLDDSVYALDATTGALAWTHLTGGNVGASAGVAGGVVFAASQDQVLYALDATTGATLWSDVATDSWADPVVSDGVLYAGDFDGILHAWGLP